MDSIERIAEAIFVSDFPRGDWAAAEPAKRPYWRTMARTISAVSRWGTVEDCAKRLAHWDDVDNKRPFTAWDDKREAVREFWTRRARAGWEALHPAARQAHSLRPVLTVGAPGEGDAA